jgi:hypothetical protein
MPGIRQAASVDSVKADLVDYLDKLRLASASSPDAGDACRRACWLSVVQDVLPVDIVEGFQDRPVSWVSNRDAT